MLWVRNDRLDSGAVPPKLGILLIFAHVNRTKSFEDSQAISNIAVKEPWTGP